jgi:hypothetical protein
MRLLHRFSLATLLALATVFALATAPAGAQAGGLLPGAASAPDDAAPAQLESVSLMHVDGTITIEADGRVGDVVFTTSFDETLRSALSAKMRAWKFKPVLVGAQPRRVQTPFRVMLAATQVDGKYRVRIDDTRFGGEQTAANVASSVVPDGTAPPILAKRMAPPQYPINQLRAGRIGSVHLVLRIAPDGRIADVVATQSVVFEIDGKDGDDGVRRSLRAFEANAIAAARHWTFIVPPGAASRSASEMTGATDVDYVIRYDTGVAGQWVPVRRAPRRPVAWLPPEDQEGGGVGMAAAGQVAGVGSAYELATPVRDAVVM